MRIGVMFLAMAIVLPAQLPFPIPIIGGATEVTQLINRAELALIQAKQLQMYLDQIRHTTQYKALPWSQIDRHMAEFEKALRVGQSIAATMADADQQFKNRYPGYGQLKRRFPDEYKVWSGTAMDTLQAVLRATAEQRKKMNEEASIIHDIRDSSLSAEGRMQVQQTQVAAQGEMLNQIMKLRELLMADLSAKSMFFGMQLQKDAAAASAADRWFSYVEQNDKSNKRWRFTQ